MFLIVNLFMALSLGVQREQLEHRMGLTWPRPYRLVSIRVNQHSENLAFLLRPLDARFLTMLAVVDDESSVRWLKIDEKRRNCKYGMWEQMCQDLPPMT
jgi:hypothetical protein